MSRRLTSSSRLLALTALCLTLHSRPSVAQVGRIGAGLDGLRDVSPVAPRLTGSTVGARGELVGVVLDDRGLPLAGAVVSALGSSTLFAISDRDGRFAFRRLPPGAYVVRAHLKGYQSGRARLLQVRASSSEGVATTASITLRRPVEAESRPDVLAAGVGAPTGSAPPEETDAHAHGEVAWRLRHLKRSVLKEATNGLTLSGWQTEPPTGSRSDAFWRESLAGLGWAVDGSTRLASALFSDLGFDGQVNFLTSTSFDRPQDLLTSDAGMPRGVALVSLERPGPNGLWRMRGALTHGDLSSWLVSGSYVRTSSHTHEYEAGFSYGMQRYIGSSAATLATMSRDSRSVAAMHGYDTWAPRTGVHVTYGAEFATSDYLEDDALLSPRFSVALQPISGDSLAIRTTVSRREVAPGMEEFLPPSGGVWLPPERTFSAVSSSGTLYPERTDHVEIEAERAMAGVVVGVRVFRQHGEDQVAALFGGGSAGPSATTGHYHVGSTGDFEATGWGLRMSRVVGDTVRASVAYTRADTAWASRGADRRPLMHIARAAVRDADRIHDVTAMLESQWAPTATRVLMLYKVASAGAATDTEAEPALVGTRFEVQVNQGLPFLRFTNAHWEALVAVRNMFYGDVMNASLYDELLVVRPPTRVLGGVTVKF
jgi:hypothetical protein